MEAQAAIAEFDDSATAKEIRGDGNADAGADAEADRSLASLAGVPSGAALDEQPALSANSLELAAEEARAQAQAVGGYQAKVQRRSTRRRSAPRLRRSSTRSPSRSSARRRSCAPPSTTPSRASMA